MKESYILEDPTHKLTAAILASGYADTSDERTKCRECIEQARREVSTYIQKLLNAHEQDPTVYVGGVLHFYKHVALAAGKAIDRLNDLSAPPQSIFEEIATTDIF